MVPLREFEALLQTLMAFDIIAKNIAKKSDEKSEKNVAR